MFRALKNSLSCASKQKKRTQSGGRRNRELLLHMADLDGESAPTDDFRHRQPQRQGRNQIRHVRVSSSQGCNNSMNDWQEIVATLKKVDVSRQTSNERPANSAAAGEEADEVVSMIREESSIQPHQSQQLDVNVGSRLTPSATPLLHRMNSQELPDGEQVGERFISEYSVRLEPVIKICIPCQHEHNQALSTSPTQHAVVQELETHSIVTNSNSSARLHGSNSLTIAPPRVEVAVETSDTDVQASPHEVPEMMLIPDMPSIASTGAGDENAERITHESPLPGIEADVPMISTPVHEMVTLPEKEEKPNESETQSGDRTPAPETTPNVATVPVVEVRPSTPQESIGGDEASEQALESIKEPSTESPEEPAEAAEVEMSRQEALIMSTTEAIDVDILMLETESAVEAEQEDMTSKAEDAAAGNDGEETGDEETATLEGIVSKLPDIERATASSPTSVSLTSFVDVYDKEPLHPIDDVKSSVSPVCHDVKTLKANAASSQPNDETLVTSWLNGNRQSTSSADRWKLMKQMVKEREGTISTKSPPACVRRDRSGGKEIDSRLQQLIDNLSTRGNRTQLKEPVNTVPIQQSPINEELRNILSKLGRREQQDGQQPNQVASRGAEALQRGDRNSGGKSEKSMSATRKAAERFENRKSKAQKNGTSPSANTNSSRFNDPKTALPRRQVASSTLAEVPTRTYTYQMELEATDSVVCSFLRPADRRVVAAASKNNCAISVVAPEPSEPKQMTCSRKYQCVIRGPTKEQVVRCINFLKDTFPKSFIRYNR